MEKIIIIGGKGAAVATAELIVTSKEKYNAPYEFIGFCIDDSSLGDNINGFPILCNRSELINKYGHISDVKFIFSLYKPDCMEQRVSLLKDMGIQRDKFTNYIHPTVHIANSAVIGTGNVFSSNVVINNNVKIGDFNAFYTNVVIEHDTIIRNSNYFAAASVIGSEITIGSGNFFGLNSTVREHTTIGDYNLIGMCAGVVKNVDDRKTLIGIPAREL